MTEFSMAEIFPLIEEGIRQKGSYRFYPKGISMLPLIRENVDSVVLTAAGEVKKYDIVLYLRDNGQYVLHRVVAVGREGFDMCGDNQCFAEKGIRSEQIKARVSGLYRGEEYVSLDGRDYLKYAKRRAASIPYRRLRVILKAYLNKIIGKKIR